MKWDTRADVIERGAWFAGRIYGERCDISPDGGLFLYFATRYRGNYSDGYLPAWTAVSRPPWLTALTMWPRCETWGGGAYFADNRTVVIDVPHWESLKMHPGHRHLNLNVVPRWIGRDAPHQVLPQRPAGCAFFDGQRGRDSQGVEFAVRDGRLFRTSFGQERLICDFTDMTPERTRSPEWARQ